MPVVDKDKGWSALAKLVESVASTDPHVLVGVQGSQAASAHPGGQATNADVASWNEFGTGHIPERSFVRATIDIHEQRLLQLSAQLGKGVLAETFTPQQALGLLGEEARGLMIERINAHIPPPNAPSTIKRKGSSTPLIAQSGQLKNSITTKVAA